MIRFHGREYGTAAEIAHRLGPDVTEAMVRRWRDRDGLDAITLGRMAYSPLDRAAEIEANKRVGGKGRRRQVDVGGPIAA